MRTKATKILKEADKYMVRNKHTYKKLAGDGLFSDVQISRKIWARKESLHQKTNSMVGKELDPDAALSKQKTISRRTSIRSPSDPNTLRSNSL